MVPACSHVRKALELHVFLDLHSLSLSLKCKNSKLPELPHIKTSNDVILIERLLQKRKRILNFNVGRQAGRGFGRETCIWHAYPETCLLGGILISSCSSQHCIIFHGLRADSGPASHKTFFLGAQNQNKTYFHKKYDWTHCSSAYKEIKSRSCSSSLVTSSSPASHKAMALHLPVNLRLVDVRSITIDADPAAFPIPRAHVHGNHLTFWDMGDKIR